MTPAPDSPAARRAAALALVLAAAGSGCARAPAGNPATVTDPATRVEAIVAGAHEAGDFNGVAVVVDGGREVLARGFGVADAASGAPLTMHTRFRAASLTKLLTQAAVLVLVERGRIDLDAPLTRYRPDFRSRGGATITVRHLLAMESGLPRELTDDSATSGVELDANGFAGPFLDGLRLEPAFEPGTRSAYSNVGYWALGAVVEAVTAKTYPAAVRELVLEPLGMADTGFDVDDPAAAGHALGHGRGPDGGLRVLPPHPIRQRYASGAAHTTPADLARFFRSFATGRLLARSSRELMCRRFRGPDDDEARLVLRGSGHVPGFAHVVTFDPEADRLVMLMTNVDAAGPGPLTDLHGRLAAAIDPDTGGHAGPAPARGPRVLEVRSAKDGLPDTPIGRAATGWLDAVAAGDADRIVAARLRCAAPGVDRNALREISTQLADLRSTLGGFDVVGYLEREAGELLVVVRGSRREARMTFTPEADDPGLVADIEIDVVPRR